MTAASAGTQYVREGNHPAADAAEVDFDRVACNIGGIRDRKTGHWVSEFCWVCQVC